MPSNIKLILSLVVALVGLAAYLLERSLGNPTVGLIAGLLAVFMILSMWIFPEARRKPKQQP
ncbi:MAG: hypothetical protein CMK60_14825 [Proteobacteria bacterium]|jgi:hypothetical protein|nr:hypothetical protein [Pseudomonadota bacterium]MBP09453.1 hypothetical protein [Acidiferrobacteraceae bacterium]MDP6134950.1 hypothetical protein [Arenicellales bacterium]MDP6393658.1 hypothetical protein [Arenicellales bacterium]MDP7217838.1 hypothetical protein [Arenicellales bacterium]|tara:strand:- start:9 stop:194 length:186 start_codon:yes stop_codon:yes gene_type:complete